MGMFTTKELTAIGLNAQVNPVAPQNPRTPRGKGLKSMKKSQQLAALRHPRIFGNTPVTAELVGHRVRNPLNGLVHWRIRSQRANADKTATRTMLLMLTLPQLPVRVTLTRIGKKAMDLESVGASLKHVKDAVADCYGLDDANELFTWQFSQQLAKVYSVRIRIEPTLTLGETRPRHRGEGIPLNPAVIGAGARLPQPQERADEPALDSIVIQEPKALRERLKQELK